jgi:hypothetical protein
MPDDVDACLIDLRPAVPAQGVFGSSPRSLMTIAECLNFWVGDSGVAAHLVVLVSASGFTAGGPAARRFEEMALHGVVTLVNEQGVVASERFREFSNERIAAAFESDRAPAADGLRAKMIRRVGYFPHYGDDGMIRDYTRYYFDGQYCVEELKPLILDRLREMLNPKDESMIVHVDAAPDWLPAALSVPVSELAHEGFNVRVGSQGELPDEPGGTRTVVAVHPVHHHGYSLTALAEAAQRWAPAAEIKAMAIAATALEGVPATIKVGGKEIEVPRLMEVVQRRIPKDVFSPDPAYYAAADGAERFLAMTSGDFWLLAEEAGFIPERDAPPYRAPLRAVPDLLGFVDSNAAWIVDKIDSAIHQFTARSAREVRLALIADEEAATKLGDALQEMLGNDPLRIPRRAIDEWKRDQSDRTTDAWEDNGVEWYEDVRSALGGRREVVVIDEFAMSGSTLANLASMLRHLNFDVRLVMAIAAFWRSQFTAALDPIPSFALYTTEWGTTPAQERIFDRAPRASA